MTRLARSIVLLLAVASLYVPVARADQTTDESAIWQLTLATKVHRDRAHNVLLRALRQLKDPALEPLFSQLVQHEAPEMQIHGILGLGEIDPKHRINLALVADLKNAAIQAQVVSLALETDLLDTDQCKQLMSWPELDPAVKLIVAAKLLVKGEPVDAKLLDDAMLKEDNLALSGMAAMLRLQQGDDSANAALDKLSQSAKPERDIVRSMLLQTAIQNELTRIGPWAMRIIAENPTAQGLSFLSLRAAVKFKQPGAAERFAEQYRAVESVADRIRLSVLALEVAESLPPEFFDVLIQDAEPIIQYMGRTGKPLSQGADAVEPMLKLVEQNHILASKWVLAKAEKLPADKAKALYVGIILAAESEPNDPRFRGQRIENAVLATEALAEKLGEDKALLGRLFERVKELTGEAMVMGLIRTQAADAHTMLGESPKMPTDTAANLYLLLRAKHGAKLTPPEMDRLGLIVRGGAGLQPPLRIQAAWVYGKLAGKQQVYLASVLGK